MKKWLLKSIEQYGAVVFVVAAICLTLLWAGALVLMVKELVAKGRPLAAPALLPCLRPLRIPHATQTSHQKLIGAYLRE